jgi:myosin-crossreactive antigen
MKNYRIKKVTDKYSTRYYPQEKWFGLFWMNMFGYDGWYSTFEEAQKRIFYVLRKPVVEYLEVDCGENK